MTPFFSSTKKVDCPDGPRYILKHPEKAFAITFPEWDVRVKALVKRYSLSEGKAESKILKRTNSIVKNLTENYAALQAHYQAAYLGWCGNPCSKEAEKAYNDAKAKILEKEFALKELDAATNRAIALANVDEKAPKRAGGTGGFEFPHSTGRGAGIPNISETSFETIEKLVAKLKI